MHVRGLTPRLDCLEEPACLARRRPGFEPGLRKAVQALLHGEHYTRVSEYEWDGLADELVYVARKP
jgi:hypothetical protein